MVAGRVIADQRAMSIAVAVTGAAPVVRMFITVEVVAMTMCKVNVNYIIITLVR